MEALSKRDMKKRKLAQKKDRKLLALAVTGFRQHRPRKCLAQERETHIKAMAQTCLPGIPGEGQVHARCQEWNDIRDSKYMNAGMKWSDAFRNFIPS